MVFSFCQLFIFKLAHLNLVFCHFTIKSKCAQDVRPQHFKVLFNAIIVTKAVILTYKPHSRDFEIDLFKRRSINTYHYAYRFMTPTLF